MNFISDWVHCVFYTFFTRLTRVITLVWFYDTRMKIACVTGGILCVDHERRVMPWVKWVQHLHPTLLDIIFNMLNSFYHPCWMSLNEIEGRWTKFDRHQSFDPSSPSISFCFQLVSGVSHHVQFNWPANTDACNNDEHMYAGIMQEDGQTTRFEI